MLNDINSFEEEEATYYATTDFTIITHFTIYFAKNVEKYSTYS